MFLNGRDFIGMLIFLGFACGLLGWGVIEGLIWLSGFVSISFGGAPQ